MSSPEIIIAPVIFFSLVAIVKIISDNRLRRILIERGKLDENIKFIFQNRAELNPLSSVKWGLVLIGIGLALLLGQLFPYTFADEAILGLMFLFAGIGFLVYYALMKKQLAEQGSPKDLG